MSWVGRGQGFGHCGHGKRVDFSNGSGLIKQWLRVQGTQRAWLEGNKKGVGEEKGEKKEIKEGRKLKTKKALMRCMTQLVGKQNIFEHRIIEMKQEMLYK